MPENRQRDWDRSPFVVICVLFAGAAFGTFGFWIAASLWYNHPATDAFWAPHGVYLPDPANELQPLEAYWVNRLLAMGKIVSPDTVMSQTMAFYDVLVAILVTLIALIGAFTYIYIRTISASQLAEASDEAAARAVNLRFASEDFWQKTGDYIIRRVNVSLTDYKDAAGQYGRINEAVENFEKRLAAVESVVASTDEAVVGRIKQEADDGSTSEEEPATEA